MQTAAAPPADLRFQNLGRPRRIWAIPAIHAALNNLMALHDTLLHRLLPGDRILYFGNYGGYGQQAAATIDELLTFRRLVLSLPGMMPHDIVYLRGAQEEMWEKMLQLQFAPNPTRVLTWMLENGIGAMLESYGCRPADGLEAARDGVMALTRWSNSIRATVRRTPGHEIFGTQQRRAAFTDGAYAPLLFVPSGLDPSQPLDRQGDSFWWAAREFDGMTEGYSIYKKVFRGYDPAHEGIRINPHSATIDAACGFGGDLVCAGIDPAGEIFEMLES